MMYITVAIELVDLLSRETHDGNEESPICYQKTTSDTYNLSLIFQEIEDESTNKNLVKMLKIAYYKTIAVQHPMQLKIEVITEKRKGEKIHTAEKWNYKSTACNHETGDILIMDADTEEYAFTLTNDNASEIAETMIELAKGGYV